MLSRRRLLRIKQTNSEYALWRYLSHRRFCGLKFFRQYSVGGYVIDFYCPRLHLAIEVDGDVHLKRIEYDNQRTHFLNAHGVQVLRVKNSEVLSNIKEVLDKIKSFSPLCQRGAHRTFDGQKTIKGSC